jgi:tryptophanyl-tRNA synthetase
MSLNASSAFVNSSFSNPPEDDLLQEFVEGEDVITPYTVSANNAESGIQYEKFVTKWGSEFLNDNLKHQISRITGAPVHPWIHSQLFFSHRSLNEILREYEKGNKFYLYTGRGPSSEALHLGHVVPFLFTKYLQDAFQVPLVVQLTDDEKFFWKNLSLDKTHELAYENAKDIIAFGFDVKKTFIFSDIDYMGSLYPTVCRIQKCLTGNHVRAALGVTLNDNIGKFAYAAIQAAPSFSTCFPHIFGGRQNVPCLIPCAVDQDPFFRLTRGLASRLGYLQPSVIHSKFLPSLTGPGTKMSATSGSTSGSSTSIFLTDTPDEIKTKIFTHAFSGGGATKKLHLAHGANLDTDISYQYLRIFCFDEARVASIGEAYRSGQMMTSEVKQILVDVLVNFTSNHQRQRALVTDEIREEFMRVRKIH